MYCLSTRLDNKDLIVLFYIVLSINQKKLKGAGPVKERRTGEREREWEK